MISLLRGLRVLDFSRLIPGAYATSKLADLGADVIKVEFPPAGDYMREFPPLSGGTNVLFQALNRNKRSIVVDPADPAGADEVEALVRSADVVVEGGRPGAMSRWGLDYQAVRALKESIVYCSLTGYGQAGPYAQLPSHGANLDLAAGLFHLGPAEDGAVAVPNIRVFVASQAGGLHAALAIMAAVHRAEQTGTGAYLDISAFDAAVSWQYANLVSVANTCELFPGSEGMGPLQGCYFTSDGGWVMFAAIEPKFWKAFCAAVTRPDLAGRVNDDAKTDFAASDGSLRSELAGIIGARSQSDWVALAIEHQLPISPVNSPFTLMRDEHVVHRQLFVEYPDGFSGLALPIKVDGESFEVVLPAPGIGEHNEEVLAELRREASERPGSPDGSESPRQDQPVPAASYIPPGCGTATLAREL